MRLAKSSTILLNIALSLAIVILVRFLVVIPKNASAAQNREYTLVNIVQGESVTKTLNANAQQGWRLAFAFKQSEYGAYSFVLER